ncbi:TRAP transporter small permease subunit [Roseibium aggregatum]|jgi:TRAP-type C4-dicarboxylate transport system permease small subunit|nr:2,3-diketo-L-gulonate TRAP transporter small permease protein YiaM [Labrenzia sp. THAF191b]QFT07018.1 2,3-diketo-L-gulonate TRAP transporter small permease protein YiaM [Labrenzia sp. THAF191a]QFT18562.1 2,3-diketo-L-gulonate TRAP transporter small permease protein YiaM [Labrenzia sp. THAF187b]UES36388.1 TRAP transporter small permease subunit [Roseibium aggregatum]UES41139.1 TRAP transporter small permease subunit [Roseibium aggregatum]
MTQSNDAVADQTKQATAQTEQGRADGAPELLHFDETETDLSALKWIDAPGILVFWVLAVVVFLQFFTRYVLNDSLAWTEEVARYLLILVCFLGAITATRRGAHITLEFLMRMVPPRLAKALTVLSQTITLGFFASMTWIGIELTQKTRQKMISLPIPKAWIYTICVVALGLMAFYSAIWLWRRLRQSPEDLVRSLDDHLPTD